MDHHCSPIKSRKSSTTDFVLQQALLCCWYRLFPPRMETWRMTIRSHAKNQLSIDNVWCDRCRILKSTSNVARLARESSDQTQTPFRTGSLNGQSTSLILNLTNHLNGMPLSWWETHDCTDVAKNLCKISNVTVKFKLRKLCLARVFGCAMNWFLDWPCTSATLPHVPVAPLLCSLASG